MTLEHIAIWTDNLEKLKDFYVRYFEGIPNQKYINLETGFQSYFISFASGARLELMAMPNIPDNANDTIVRQHKGIIHFSFAIGTREEVDAKAIQLSNDGVPILKGPRVTGDGYYEFETVDPDGNRLEVMAEVN